MAERDVVIRISAKNLTAAEFRKAQKQLEDFGKSTGLAQGHTRKLTTEVERGLNRALQQLSNQGGIATSALSKIGPVGLGVSAAIGGLALGMRELAQESQRLTEAAHKLGISTTEYQKSLGISIPLTEDAIEVGNKLSRTWNDLSTSAKNLVLNIAALDSVGFAESHPLLSQAIRISTSGLLGASEADIAAANKPFVGPATPSRGTIADNVRATEKRLEAEKKAAEATERATELLRRHEEQMEKIWQRLNREGIPTLNDLAKSFEDLNRPVIAMVGMVSNQALAKANLDSDLAMFQAQAELEPFLREAFFKQAGLLVRKEIADNQARAAIPEIIPLTLPDATEGLADLNEELANLAHLSELVGPGLASVFQGLSTGIAGIQSISGGLGKIQGGGILGAITGVAGIAGGVGAIAAPIIALLKGLGGPDIGRDVGRDIGANISEELEKAIEESGKNAQLFLREIFSEGGLGIDQFAREVGDLLSMFERGELSETGLIAELDETIPILIQHFRELGPAGEAEIQRIIAAAERLGIETESLQQLMQATFSPATVEEMAAAFGLTNDQIRAMAEELGLNVQTNLERVAASVGLTAEEFNALGAALEERFGIPAEQLQAFLESSGLSAAELAEKLGVDVGEGAQAAADAQELANQRLGVGVDLAGALADNLERAANASSRIGFSGFDSFTAQHGIDRVFSRPTIGVFGEAGPEHVKITPLGGGGGGGFGGVTMHFAINMGSGADPQELIRLLRTNMRGAADELAATLKDRM